MSSKRAKDETSKTIAADPASGLITVTRLASELGVTARAIRFYETKGLITPSRVGTTRVYSRREAARMKLILRGKRLGFSLREIKEFLDLYDVDSTQKTQMRRLLENVRRRAAKLEEQRIAITQTLAELSELEQHALAIVDAPPKRSIKAN